MTFLLDERHWKTVADFERHLAGYDPNATAPWAKGVTYHHTYRPLATQWVGSPSIAGLKRTYLAKKPAWSSGPHLFIVAGAPNPAHDGIWQFTPLNVPGTHAGACNSSYWGLEICGDYDKAFWPPSVAALALGAGAALLRWRGLEISPTTVRGHRDCLNNKTCPGNAIDLNDVRSALVPYLTPSDVLADDSLSFTEESEVLLGPPTCTQEQATEFLLSVPHKNYTSADIALTIVPGYWATCLSVNINPAVALAQLPAEGSLNHFWGARPQRNPAGIGVNGDDADTRPLLEPDWSYNTERERWERGLSFPSWVGHAIPAHVGRLLAYVLRDSQANDAQRALIREALNYRSLPRVARGSVTKLKHLGAVHNPANAGLPRKKWKAGWAWDGEEYGAKLAGFMTAMREMNV